MNKVQDFTLSTARPANSLAHRLAAWLGPRKCHPIRGGLSELNDHLLADIGIARDEVRHVEYIGRAADRRFAGV